MSSGFWKSYWYLWPPPAYLDEPAGDMVPLRCSRNVPEYGGIALWRCIWWWRIRVLVCPCGWCAGETVRNVPVTSASGPFFFLVDVFDAGSNTFALNALLAGLAVGWSSLVVTAHCKHCGNQESRTNFWYSRRTYWNRNKFVGI